MPRSKPLILVVDDEENFREIFSAKLKAAGFDVDTAKNEAEALAKAHDLPDLILMDIFIPPGPTGTDIALNIHQAPETKDVRIAFLTNLKDPWPAINGDHKKVSEELGMIDFLEKTGDLDVLVKKVNEILARGAQSPTSSVPTNQPPAPADPIPPVPPSQPSQ